MQGGLAQVVERSIRIRQAPGWRPGYSNWLFFTIIFIANFNASLLCQTEKVGEQKKCPRGISSSGRALDSHSRGTGIDTRILQLVFLYNYFRCQLQHKFFVPNRKGWRIEKICARGISSSGRALDSHSRGTGIGFSNQFFFTIIFGLQLQLVKSLQLFSLQLPISTQVCCAKQKRLKNRNNIQGGLAQVVERWIRIREAPGSRHGYSNWLFFTIIFIANFNASLLCQTEKFGEKKQSTRLKWQSARFAFELDSPISFSLNYFRCQNTSFFVPSRVGEQNSQGDQLKWQSARFAFERHRDRYPDSPISFSLQLFSLPIATQVFCAKQKRLENRKICKGDQLKWQSARFAFERHRDRYPDSPISFSLQLFSLPIATQVFVPNRKGWRIEKMSKGGQLKWQSAGFAFERHRDRYPDSPISFSLQLFSLPIATQVFCAKQKSLENRKICKGDQLKWQSARFAFERHRDRDTDTPIGYSLQLFSLPISTQVCCAKQKRLKNRNNVPRGISSSGRALDSHSRGTGIETRILQLVILYNYFHCQFQRKFVVPNRKVWRKETKYKRDQLKWQSARFAFESHRDRYPDSPISFSLQLFSLPIATQVFCAKQKRLENRTNMQGGLAQVVERSIRIRQAPGWRPGYSNWLFFTIFHCQFQRKFFVPNRKGWRIEKMSKGDQLKWQSARFAFERHRDRYPDSPISFSLQLFSLPIATQVFCAKQKRLENRKNVQGGLAQVVERSIRIREAPGSRHGYSNWLFFTIIFIANFNASLLCQTEKVEEQKQYPKGDQLKWQSAGFAFERHRDRDTDTPIGYSLQLFSLPISTQVCCAKQKSLENRKNVQGGLAQVVERSIRIREAPGSIPGFSNQFFFTIIFVANFNTSLLCQTEKVGEQKQICKGISSSGRALDSHSRGTGIETRILQLVILYNYFHCQFQRKFVVPNRKG